MSLVRGHAAPGDRRDTWIAAALALLAVFDVAALAPFLDARAAALTFYDDAFYYFQIARNVARGAGFSFDGLHATSGFHPLWLLAQVPLFAALSGDVAPLHGVLLLEAVLVAASCVTVFHALRPRLGRSTALATALFLLAQPGALRLLRGGMEGALALCLFTLAWAQWLAVRDDPEASLAPWWRLGGLSALFFLARLEAAVAAVIIAVLARPQLGQDRRRALALMLPVALTAVAYLAWTRWTFETWGPVSALVKTRIGGEEWAHQSAGQRLALLLYVPWGIEPHVRRLLAALGIPPSAAPGIGTLVALAALALVVWQRRSLLPQLRSSGAAFVVATAAAMMLMDKASVGLMVDWYRAPSLLALAIVACAFLPGRPRLARIAIAVLVGVCLARVPQPAWYVRSFPVARLQGLQAAEWLRPRLAAGAVAASWNAGLVGYFAGGRVVNLDGLVNDTAFLREVVRGGDLAGYLDRERIQFLADSATAEARLAPLVRRYPPSVAAAVEARYRQVAAFDGACEDAAACPRLLVWERRQAGGP